MTPEALAALHLRCFSSPRPWSAEEFETLLAQPNVFFRTESGGFVLGRAVAGEAELLTLAVAPEARRKGLGKALLAQFEAAARKAGAEVAFLEVAAGNSAARALYKQAGWHETGRRPAYYRSLDGHWEDAMILSLNL